MRNPSKVQISPAPATPRGRASRISLSTAAIAVLLQACGGGGDVGPVTVSTPAAVDPGAPSQANVPSASATACNFFGAQGNITRALAVYISNSGDMSQREYLKYPGGPFQGRAVSWVGVGSRPLSGPRLGTGMVVKMAYDYNAATRAITHYGYTSSVAALVGGQVIAGQLVGASLVETESTAVYTPPWVNTMYAMAPGQTLTQASTEVLTTQASVNGTAQPLETITVTNADTVQFIGFEKITLPRGTFDTCKYQDGAITRWNDASSGIEIKTQVNGVTTTLFDLSN